MQRINTPTKAVDLFGAGKHGFTPGNPLGAIPATRFSQDWCNAVQEEIARTIEGAGSYSAEAGDEVGWFSSNLNVQGVCDALKTERFIPVEFADGRSGALPVSHIDRIVREPDGPDVFRQNPATQN